MGRTIAVLLTAFLLSGCSLFEDPVSRQLSWTKQVRFMQTVELTQAELSAGSQLNEALAQLEEWEWTREQELFVWYAEALETPLDAATIIYTKPDSDWVCGLNRFVFVEHADGRVIKAVGATGVAGCL